MSNISPSYAPAGKHLVEVSAVGMRDDYAGEIARRAAEILGDDASSWELLTTHQIEYALPVITEHAYTDVSAKILFAGDINHASIQGALASGKQAAQRITSGK